MILKRQCSRKHLHHSTVFLSNKSTVISDLMLFFTKNLILSQNGPKGTHLKNNDTFSLSAKNLLNPRSDTFYLAFYWADSIAYIFKGLWTRGKSHYLKAKEKAIKYKQKNFYQNLSKNGAPRAKLSLLHKNGGKNR